MCALCIVITAYSQSDSSIVKNKWSGSLSIGLNSSSGNINRFGSNSKLIVLLDQKKADWELDIHFQNFFNNGVKLDETLESSILGIFKTNSKHRFYGKVSVYRNEFRGFSFQLKEGIGHLFKLVNKPAFSIGTRLGYQIRHNQIARGILNEFHDGTHHFALFGARGTIPLMKNISADFQIDHAQDFKGIDNHYFDILSTLTMKVNEIISVKMNHKYWYAGIPVTGRQAIDQQFNGSIAFTF
ncbi:MAG: DUF481 domain-containing protein [Cyclobacteriaceae bacterium]